MEHTPLRQAAEEVVDVLRQAGHVALFAGGCVRDMLMGRSPTDIDIATDAPPDRVVLLFRRTRQVGAKFGVVLVHWHGHEMEVATFRTESDYADHRRPGKVAFTTAQEDAKRRDFTINGMFYDPLADEVIDYVGGGDDLAARRVRAIGVPDERFSEDHLRMLRAVRFAARFGFELETATLDAIRRNASQIRTISSERVRMEIEQILLDPSRASGWGLLRRTGLSLHLVEGLHWTDVEADTAARRLTALPNTVTFPLAAAALLVSHGPRTARESCLRLRFSTAEMDAVVWLLTQLPRAAATETLDLADVRLLLADPRFSDLTALLLADLVSRDVSPAPHALLLDRAARVAPAQAAPPPLLTGDDLMAMKLPPGPRYGLILDQVYRAQLNEEIRDHEAALAMARQLWSDRE